MNRKIKISESVLSDLYHFLDNEKIIGQKAKSTDLFFITDGYWLKDAAVIDVISNKDGAWEVSLIFAHYKNPLRLIIRKITTCFSKQKAQAAAFYMRKEAAKDRRGTLQVSIKDIQLCAN